MLRLKVSEQDRSLSNIEQLSSALTADNRLYNRCKLDGIALRSSATMHFLSAHCRVCKSDQFRAEPPEDWIERVLLPRLFLCPGRCVVCHKRRYLPTFQRWTALPNSWR